ncbi:MAG: hypothetical protein ABIQ53_08915 [Terracoccus sp.]
MPEPVDAERSLEERLARAAGAVPGVARLEPSLAHAIRGLARLGRSPSTEDADPPDGVSVTRREDAVDVAVEISVTGPRTALETAVAVREAVRAELSLAAVGGGAVNVRVLSVDAAVAGHDDVLGTASGRVDDEERELR